MTKHSVLLALEGTYPFHGGGVSTWAHILCNRIKDFNFKIYSVNAFFEKKAKYDLCESIEEVVQVPMWYALEPREILRFDDTYSSYVKKRENLKKNEVKSVFVPLLKRLITQIYSPKQDVTELENIFMEMWYFFQVNDYKSTMKEENVWDTFKFEILKIIDKEGIDDVVLLDLTVAMRWIYHFLMPLSIDFPKSSIVHLTLSGFLVLPAIVQKKVHNTPILLTEHGVFIRERLIAISQSDSSYFLKDFLIRFSECIARLAYTNSDVILSVNKFNFKWELKYGAKPEQLRVAYNGIDHMRFVPLEKPQQLKNIPTVVAMARIFALKDILTMIRSCKVVKEVFPNIEYRIYGENDAVPEYTKQCLDLIEELGLQENFKLLGPHRQPEKVFCEGDISILTSISEGFPYTIIESMSCAIPVVATDVGGVYEALTSDCGILCKPKDPVDIGNAVIKLLSDDKLRKEMGANCRKRIEENFTIDTFVKEYNDVYHELLAKSSEKINTEELVVA